MGGEPEVTVVVATHNRSARLARLLDALRVQTLPTDRFEVVVVDDASSDETPQVLADQAARGGLALRVLRREDAGSPAAARNVGWRAARAPVVAFTDDDCRPTPRWLEAGLAAGQADDAGDVIVQGAVQPDPEEAHLVGPFARSLSVFRLDGWYPTANIFYPRSLLEWVGGFDEEGFPGLGGEDTDLGWRAADTGARVVFSEDALMHHCVHVDGPLGRLRYAGRTTQTIACLARHPLLRRYSLIRGLFLKDTHYHLVRTLSALALPRPLRWIVAPYFAWRYAILLRFRAVVAEGPGRGGGLALVPYYALEDALETITAARGGLRYRTPVL
jgi:GT2 family glycosyltransferase